MSQRKRRIVLHNDNTQSRMLAKKLLDKGYTVMLQYDESDEIRPFPF
jgi:hypothetical protein